MKLKFKNGRIGAIFSRLEHLSTRYLVLLYSIPVIIAIYFLYLYIKLDYAHLIHPLYNFFIAGIFSFVLTLFVTPITIILAKKTGCVKNPAFPKHRIAEMPLLGGVAIYLVMLIVSLFHWPWSIEMQSIFLGAFILLIIGTIDDVYPLSSSIRLFGQIVASLIIMSSGLIVSFMPGNWWGTIIAVIITFIWILGIVNATNFFDGADGLTAGMSGFACVFFFLITLVSKQYQMALVTAILCGCCMGFLIFNYKPAKIYLGDGGSTTLGFFLASFALYGGWSSKGLFVALGIPVLILGVLIFDMIYITVSRIKNKKVRNLKEWLDYRGRDHFHHRLMNLGLKEAESVSFIYIVCIILGLSSLVLEHTKYSFPIIISIIQAALMFVIITILMLAGRKLSKSK